MNIHLLILLINFDSLMYLKNKLPNNQFKQRRAKSLKSVDTKSFLKSPLASELEIRD